MSVDNHLRAQQVATKNVTVAEQINDTSTVRIEPARITGGDASAGYTVEQLNESGNVVVTWTNIYQIATSTLAYLPGRREPVLIASSGSGGASVVSATGCFTEFTL
jgi:hypothetical protein